MTKVRSNRFSFSWSFISEPWNPEWDLERKTTGLQTRWLASLPDSGQSSVLCMLCVNTARCSTSITLYTSCRRCRGELETRATWRFTLKSTVIHPRSNSNSNRKARTPFLSPPVGPEPTGRISEAEMNRYFCTCIEVSTRGDSLCPWLSCFEHMLSFRVGLDGIFVRKMILLRGIEVWLLHHCPVNTPVHDISLYIEILLVLLYFAEFSPDNEKEMGWAGHFRNAKWRLNEWIG